MAASATPRAALLSAGLGLALLLAAAPARAESSVYRAQHRTAEELLPLAKAALAGQGNAVADPGTNSIVLLGPPGAVAEARALLEAQDRALRTVIVHYEERRRSELEESGIDVRWSAGTGAVRVGNAVRRGDDGTRVVIRPEATERQGDARTAGTLRVLDGQAGRITTGQNVPVETGRVLADGRGRRLAVVDTHRVDADTGFEVRPRVLGDGQVRLEIRPFGARVQPDGTIATSGATTTVVLQEGGEPAVIGGLGSGVTSGSSSLSGRSARTSRDDRVLLLSVELE